MGRGLCAREIFPAMLCPRNAHHASSLPALPLPAPKAWCQQNVSVLWDESTCMPGILLTTEQFPCSCCRKVHMPLSDMG